MAKMKQTEERYVLTCTRPEGVTVAQMNDYIRSAVTIWSRGGDPMDPLWEVGDHKIKVKRLKPDEDIFKVGKASPFVAVPLPSGTNGGATH